MTEKNKQSSKIAEKNHQGSNYKSSQDIDIALAMTHEQANDTLIEGTIDGKIYNANGTNLDIPQKGYDQ
ncbi:YozQ family protein [Calidifontibacillus oryziterrae]|uniref:YozQ family protein n=1 Tax=Calidifontibacillus oryziterrae TaxID=1191699 RepID=UPI00030FA6E2|nr:YozQ family protein [Calidifontibacillus oryziterrae]